MKINRYVALLSAGVFSCLAFPANATDRVQAGQWESTLTMNGHNSTSSTCISQSDADGMNGDEKSMRAISEKKFAPEHCRVNDVKVNGNQVKLTGACDGTHYVATTDYHGDSFVANTVYHGDGYSIDSTVRSKRIGECK